MGRTAGYMGPRGLTGVAAAAATLAAARPHRHLLTAVGLDSSELGYPPEPFADVFAPELASLAPLVDDELCVIDADGLRVTPLGRLLVRNIASAFDAYLPEQLRGGQRFSRTI